MFEQYAKHTGRAAGTTRAGRIHGHMLRCVMALLGVLIPMANAAALEPVIRSLINDPTIVSAELQASPATLRLITELQYANDCLADTGIAPWFADFRGVTAADEPTVRVLMLRQRVNPNGCPDIFAPTTRRVVINSPGSRRIGRVVVLNAPGPLNRPSPRDIIVSLDASRASTSHGSQTGGVALRATDLGLKEHLPALEEVKVRVLSRQPGELRYSVEFKLLSSGRCGDTSGVIARLFESPRYHEGGDTEQQIAWLLISVPRAKDCPVAADGTRVVEHIEAVGRLRHTRLVIINDMQMTGATRALPFSTFDLR